MNSPDPVMPKGFGLGYVFWMICRWIYFNPLTLLLAGQDIVIQLIADYPALKWLGTAGGILGVIIAQVRNQGKTYGIPVEQTHVNQAQAVLDKSPLVPTSEKPK